MAALAHGGQPARVFDRGEYDAACAHSGGNRQHIRRNENLLGKRPPDRFQTLEFRATDVCLTLDEAFWWQGWCGLWRATCFELAALDEERGAHLCRCARMLRAAEWRAARYGVSAQLSMFRLAWRAGAELIDKLLDFVRPVLEEQDEWDEIHSLTRDVLERGNGAMRQCAAWKKETAHLEDVVDLVVRGNSARRHVMRVLIGDTTLELVQGDITQQDIDAIVNAANSRLAGAAVSMARFIALRAANHGGVSQAGTLPNRLKRASQAAAT
jgi:hypothetical protein